MPDYTCLWVFVCFICVWSGQRTRRFRKEVSASAFVFVVCRWQKCGNLIMFWKCASSFSVWSRFQLGLNFNKNWFLESFSNRFLMQNPKAKRGENCPNAFNGTFCTISTFMFICVSHCQITLKTFPGNATSKGCVLCKSVCSSVLDNMNGLWE